MQRYAATADFIIALKNFPKHKVVNFTFHDFFPATEIDRFLQLFTAPIGPLTRQNAKECLNMKLCNFTVFSLDISCCKHVIAQWINWNI